jgi:hypothetical protein
MQQCLVKLVHPTPPTRNPSQSIVTTLRLGSGSVSPMSKWASDKRPRKQSEKRKNVFHLWPAGWLRNSRKNLLPWSRAIVESNSQIALTPTHPQPLQWRGVCSGFPSWEGSGVGHDLETIYANQSKGESVSPTQRNLPGCRRKPPRAPTSTAGPLSEYLVLPIRVQIALHHPKPFVDPKRSAAFERSPRTADRRKSARIFSVRRRTSSLVQTRQRGQQQARTKFFGRA